MRRLVLFLAVSLLAGCKKDPPKPTVQTISKCHFTDLTVDDAGAVSLKATIQWQGSADTKPVGAVQFTVWDSEPPDPKSAHAPAASVACEMNAELTAAAYTGDTSSSEEYLRGETAIIRGKLDKPCPKAASDGRIVLAHLTVARDGTDVGSCVNWGTVPAAIGGGDMSEDEQAKALVRRGAQKQHPAEVAVVSAYAKSLLAAARAIDPAAPVDAAKKTCPADAKGRAPAFRWLALTRLAARIPGAPKLAPATKAEADSLPVLATSKLGDALDPDASVDAIVRAAERLRDVSKYAVVATTVAVTHPSYDLPAAPSPNYRREGTLTPGSFSGVVYVVDRDAGTIACEAPLVAKSKATAHEANVPDLGRVVEESFQREMTQRMHETVHAMAPGLTDAAD